MKGAEASKEPSRRERHLKASARFVNGWTVFRHSFWRVSNHRTLILDVLLNADSTFFQSATGQGPFGLAYSKVDSGNLVLLLVGHHAAYEARLRGFAWLHIKEHAGAEARHGTQCEQWRNRVLEWFSTRTNT